VLVSNPFFTSLVHDRYDVGSRVPVTYVKSRPEYFYIPGAEPTARDVGIADGMFRYGAIASAVFLAGLIGLFFVGRGQGGASLAADKGVRRPRPPLSNWLARLAGAHQTHHARILEHAKASACPGKVGTGFPTRTYATQ
jgi:hypothetical protein